MQIIEKRTSKATRTFRAGSDGAISGRFVGYSSEHGGTFLSQNLAGDPGESGAASGRIFGGEIELDESYFGGARKSKRGRGAAGKVVVFGLLKRGGKVSSSSNPI